MMETFTTNHAELWQASWQPRVSGAASFAPVHSKVQTQVTEQPKSKKKSILLITFFSKMLNVLPLF